MKILLIALLISMNALATEVNLDGIDDLSQDKYTAPLTEDYKADGDYKGRNENSANTLSNKTIAKSGTLSKSVSTTSSKKSAQYENLESNAGELIQKLEDDRIKITKTYENLYTESKDTVKDTYELTKQINLDNLGSEQDPNVTNAFKCKDSKNCNKSTDKRVIKECQKSEMLTWSGHEWSCVSIFADPKAPKCNSDQWYKPVSGGAACVDYIYEWKKTGFSSCNAEALKEEVYSCNRKKTVSDSGTIVSDSKCLGDKPKGKSELCQANWSVGSWGGCNKVCGGGTQTRSVTCPTNYVCNSQKPSTRKSCNIHTCYISWTVGSWGGCSKSCGSGTKSRSVTCRSGYICASSKPSTRTSCNTHKCPANWIVGSWSSCTEGTKRCTDQGRGEANGSYSCGNGVYTQTRSVTCPSGYACNAAKPSTSVSCTPRTTERRGRDR